MAQYLVLSSIHYLSGGEAVAPNKLPKYMCAPLAYR